MERVWNLSNGTKEEPGLSSAHGQVQAMQGSEVDLSAAADAIAQQVVRVEANFLRLPLFTLDNKHMRSMDGLRCEGTFRRGGKSYAFTYAVTRNTATYYPGPLARSAHFALLSIATDAGIPIRHPVRFTWRELCGRMKVQPSGQIVTALREALTATKGLMIESNAALFSKEANVPLSTDDKKNSPDDKTKLLGLYDEVEFHGLERPDGSIADINAVWFSHWYLENLNALYSGPLDYTLWRSLNEHSLIASRLYEFLFFKFYGGRDLLRFNYPTLVQFIPVRTERYLSHARKQLQPAFDLLTVAGVLAKVQWVESSGGLPQLLLHRGPVLVPGRSSTEAVEIGDEDFTLDRIEDVHASEWQIVSAFHQAWGNAGFTPSKGEVDLARTLIAKHGLPTVQTLLPRLVKRLKIKWSDAKSFVAVSRYFPEVLQEWQRENRMREREQRGTEEQAQARRQKIRQAQDQAVLKALWDALSASEQAAIREPILKAQPPQLRKHPGLVERLCLRELAGQKGIPLSDEAA